MSPIMDLRAKPLDVEILMLQTQFEVGAAKHNSLVEWCYEAQGQTVCIRSGTWFFFGINTD